MIYKNKSPLELLSDKNATIDDRFKSKLRKDLLRKINKQSNAKRQKGRILTIALTIPALALVILGIITILPASNKDNPNGSGIAFKPQSVKAQELITETLRTGNNGDKTYNFKKRVQVSTRGSGYAICQNTANAMGGFGSSEIYSYNNPTEDTYYFYAKVLDESGHVLNVDGKTGLDAKMSVNYEQTAPGTDVLESWAMNSSKQLPLYLLSNKEGRIISSSSDLVSMKVDNKEVFEIYATTTPNVTNTCENGKDFYKITVDANTKELISFDIYFDKVASSNLVSSSKEVVTYKVVTPKEAKAELIKAGMQL
jgi:hypothetical protein